MIEISISEKTPEQKRAACEKSRQWRLKNRERHLASVKAWRVENREAYREHRRRYREKHPEQVKAAGRRQSAKRSAAMAVERAVRREARAVIAASRRAASSERQRELQRKWRASHPGYIREWKAKNRDKVRARKFRRRKRLLAELFALQRGRCPYCPANLVIATAHVDHVVPLARGGPNRRSNLQLTCAPCNLTKRARDPVDFARSLGRLI